MSPPRVTVCIPSYNCAAFLAEAIESVLAQSFTDYELLVLDDCSSDQSSRIAAQYAAQDARIITWVHQENLGMVQNWNTCLNAARGDYVKYVFGDDLLASCDALMRMVAELDADPAVSLVATARNIIDHQSMTIEVASSFPADALLAGGEVISRCLFTQKNLVGEPSVVMFRKSQALRGFDGRYSQLVDLEMWFHLLEQGKFAYIGEALTSFRVHGDQQTKKNVRNLVHVEEMLDLMAQYGGRECVTVRPATKLFLRYHQLYRLWKGYKSNLLSREAALARIGCRLSVRKFFLLLPLYKLLNPLWKICCRVRIWLA